MTSETVYADPDDLQAFMERLLAALDLDADAARQVAESVIFAESRGLACQGIQSIPALAERLARGGITARATISVRQVSASAASVDGGNGPGAVVANTAMRKAVAMAAESGVGIVTARRSNGFGAGSCYAMQALDRTFIGLCATNASACAVAATGGGTLDRSQGFAAAVPAGRRSPIVVDLAPVQNHAPKMTVGAIASILIDVFTGVLSGSAIGHQVRDAVTDAATAGDTGQLFMAIDPGMFMPLHAFLDRVDLLVATLKGPSPAPGADPVLVPGEVELRREKETRKSGIPLAKAAIGPLERLGREFGLPLPAISDSPLRRGR